MVVAVTVMTSAIAIAIAVAVVFVVVFFLMFLFVVTFSFTSNRRNAQCFWAHTKPGVFAASAVCVTAVAVSTAFFF